MTKAQTLVERVGPASRKVDICNDALLPMCIARGQHENQCSYFSIFFSQSTVNLHYSFPDSRSVWRAQYAPSQERALQVTAVVTLQETSTTDCAPACL